MKICSQRTNATFQKIYYEYFSEKFLHFFLNLHITYCNYSKPTNITRIAKFLFYGIEVLDQVTTMWRLKKSNNNNDNNNNNNNDNDNNNNNNHNNNN